MIVYLIDKETKEVKNIVENVSYFTNNSVTYINNGYLCKNYCLDNEYYTDHLDEIESEELENNFN